MFIIYLYTYIWRDRDRERESFEKLSNPNVMNLLEGKSRLKRFGFNEHSSGL